MDGKHRPLSFEVDAFDRVILLVQGIGDGGYTPFTQDQLEAHPGYDAATYSDQRDQQRLIVR